MAYAPIPVDLVSKAKGGDRDAIEEVLRLLQPMLRAYFIKRIGVKPEVDDLVQNTMLRVHRGISDLNQLDRLKAFTLKAALFEVQDLYRGRYSARERTYDPDMPPKDEPIYESKGLAMDLENALNQLSPKAKKIVLLKQYGYRYNEIAEMVGSTEAAIKMQVKRAFEKLRELLVSIAIILLPFSVTFYG